ncbi:hypothetical protein MTO96_028642 [Rhipicephalus appendiculatus]
MMENLCEDAHENSVSTKASNQAEQAIGAAGTSAAAKETEAGESTDYSPPCTRSQKQRFANQRDAYMDLSGVPTRLRRRRTRGVHKREGIEQVPEAGDGRRCETEVSASKNIHEDDSRGQPK